MDNKVYKLTGFQLQYIKEWFAFKFTALPNHGIESMVIKGIVAEEDPADMDLFTVTATYLLRFSGERDGRFIEFRTKVLCHEVSCADNLVEVSCVDKLADVLSRGAYLVIIDALTSDKAKAKNKLNEIKRLIEEEI